jgi:hypothetical protein
VVNVKQIGLNFKGPVSDSSANVRQTVCRKDGVSQEGIVCREPAPDIKATVAQSTGGQDYSVTSYRPQHQSEFH